MLELDRSQAPLYVATLRGSVTVEGMDELTGYLNALMAPDTQFALIIATENVPVPAIGVIKHLASWLLRNREGLRAYAVAIGPCLPSAALRGAFKFINSAAPPPNPQAAFGTLEETEAWARAHMSEAGLVSSA